MSMWEARGVGTYSKTYPGMLGLKSLFLPLIILVSETPIMLNSKFNSSTGNWLMLKTPDVIM